MIEPLLPFYSFFLALLDALPGPVKAFMGLVIACVDTVLFALRSRLYRIANIVV